MAGAGYATLSGASNASTTTVPPPFDAAPSPAAAATTARGTYPRQGGSV